MYRLEKYSDFLILEKSIGSENTRLKYYSDIPKSIFYKIINIDPTSVRKKDFSKIGKYSKWLLLQWKNKSITEELLNDTDYIKQLNYYLFIFSTNWYKKGEKFVYVSSNKVDYGDNDIFKFKLSSFISKISQLKKKYEFETENSKFDLVYSDDKIRILIPMNFSASYETAKNTDWCSQSLMGYSYYSDKSIMFRIIPKNEKNSKYDKLKLTWLKDNGNWQIACSKYPEISGSGSPFDIIDGKENWIIKKNKFDEDYNNSDRSQNLKIFGMKIL